MKEAKIVLRDKMLTVSVPETQEELRAGWRGLPDGHDGMLFDVKPFAPKLPMWIPIALGDEAEALDVLWLNGGMVASLATMRGGMLQGYGDHVLELRAGWAKLHEVSVGDIVMIEHDTRGH